MKIRKGLLFSVLLVAGLAFVGFSPQSYAATQKKDLIDDPPRDCDGPVVGKVVVKKVGSDVLVKVKLTNAAPNTLYAAVWRNVLQEHCYVLMIVNRGLGQVLVRTFGRTEGARLNLSIGGLFQ